MGYRVLALPFFATLIMALMLMGLGKWQLDRRAWKLGVVERIETRVHDEAISLTTAREIWRKTEDIDYTRVLLVGRFLHEHERHLYALVDGLAGWKVVTPLQTASGDIVLVDRGFVPDQLKLPAARQRGQIEGVAELTGLARASQPPSWFTPVTDPAANRWFRRDVPGLIASLPPELAANAAPFIVEAEAAPVPGDWPRSGVTMLKITNRHLEYALTWFALAATLLIVFAVYARNRLATEAEGGADAEIAERGPVV
jgi:surfeit locus 1 family protein